MRSNRLFCALAVACLSAASAFSAAADRVVAAVSRGFDRLISAWAEPFQPQTKPPSQEKPRVALVAAKAFIARRTQRRRPERHPGWLMCPST